MTTTDDRLDLGPDSALADLVAATAETASALPTDLAAGVRTVLAEQVSAARPRVPAPTLDRAARLRRRRRMTLVAAPLLAAAVVGAVVVAAEGSAARESVVASPARQLAWSPVAQLLPAPVPPAQPAADASQSWTTACGEDGSEADVGAGAAAASARASHHVLAERRGGSVLCVDVAFGDGTPTQPTVALGGLTTPDGGQFSYTFWEHQVVAPPDGGDVTVLGGDATTTSHRGDSTDEMLYGAAGPQVDGVEVVLGSGQHVTASVHDGVWAAWWPLDRGQARGARLLVTTDAGQRTVDATAARVSDADTPGATATGRPGRR